MTNKAKRAKKPRKSASPTSKRLLPKRQNKPRETQIAKVVSRLMSSPASTPREAQPPNKPVSHPGGRILVEKIDGETVVGDLIVAFPWTREVLKKYGLRLEVEEAGDIFMSVDAFAALRNLEPASLVHELVESSKQPPQLPQPPPPLVAAPTA